MSTRIQHSIDQVSNLGPCFTPPVSEQGTIWILYHHMSHVLLAKTVVYLKNYQRVVYSREVHPMFKKSTQSVPAQDEMGLPDV
jgi:hypothetical protein